MGADGTGALIHQPSCWAAGHKFWQLLALSCTLNTTCDNAGRLWAGCCSGVGRLILYKSQRNTVTQCVVWRLNWKTWQSTVPQLLWRICIVGPAQFATAWPHLLRANRLSPYCSVTAVGGSIAPPAACPLTDAEPQTVSQASLRLKMKLSSAHMYWLSCVK